MYKKYAIKEAFLLVSMVSMDSMHSVQICGRIGMQYTFHVAVLHEIL